MAVLMAWPTCGECVGICCGVCGMILTFPFALIFAPFKWAYHKIRGPPNRNLRECFEMIIEAGGFCMP